MTTFTVNLYGEKDSAVTAKVLGVATSIAFISLHVGPLGVILANAAQARAIADALHVAATELDAATVKP